MELKISKLITEYIVLLKKGDDKAFEALYDIYYPRILSFLKALNLEKEADDVIQDTFISLWRNKEHVDITRNFDSYMFTIAKNYALKALKKNLTLISEDLEQLELEDSFSVDQQINVKELEDIFKDSLEKLPQRQRTIFRMKRFEGMTINEIAEDLGISPKTVENHMTYAIKSLKKRIPYSTILLLIYII